jgi:protein gp37
MAHKKSLAKKWGGLVKKDKNGKLQWTGKIKLFSEALTDKKLRGKGKKIFIDSKADLFHPKVPFAFIEIVMATIEECPQHDMYLLTKRIERAAEYFNGLGKRYELSSCPNIHLGATICNQAEADEKIPILLSIPAAHHWISFEPLLGPIKDAKLWRPQMERLAAIAAGRDETHIENPTPRINFAVIGCESGPKRRPIARKHIKDLYDQCKAAGVDVVVKQVDIDGKICHDLERINAELGD